MKTIFLNRFFYPDHSATSQMLSDLAFGLVERGKKVAVITSRLKYDDPDVVLPAFECIRGVNIHRIWTSRFGRSNLFGRAIDYVTFYISAAWFVWRLVRPGDVVVSKTDPPMLGVPVVSLARLRGAASVNWLQDLFPEVAQALDFGGRKGHFFFLLLRKVRDQSLLQADMNVVIGELMAGRLAQIGVKPDRIRVIPNWADCDAIVPISHEKNPLREEWGLAESFVVAYSGNLGRAHDIDTLLSAIAITEDSPPNKIPRWLFIGGGAQFDRLKITAKERGLQSLVFQPYQPRERLKDSLSAADAHLVSLRPEMEGLIVPSKFYGIVAAGRVAIFIGDRNGEVARLIEKYECGVTVAQTDGKSLAAAVLEFASNPSRCRILGENGRRAAEANFTKTGAIQRWADLLESLTQGP